VINCGNGTTGGSDPTSVVYEGKGDDGNTYKLEINKDPNRAAYNPQTNDTYVLTVIYVNGPTKTNNGIITVSENGSNLILSLSGGLPLTVTISGGKLALISGTIYWSDLSTPTTLMVNFPSGTNTGGDTSWKAVPNSPFNGIMESINTITYGNGKFVAGGRGLNNDYSSYGKIATSSDGITWKVATNHPFYMDDSSSSISEIAYGNGKFVAVDGYLNGKMAYSSDGENWTAVSDNKINNTNTCVVYGNGKFVAFTKDGNMIAYSPDGAVWTAVTNPPFKNVFDGYIEAIAYGNNKFIALGGFSEVGSTSVKISTSTDGVTWTTVKDTNLSSISDNPINAVQIRAITYGSGKFIAADYHGRMATSPDGEIWTSITNNPFDKWPNTGNAIKAISYGNGKFVAGGEYGQMAVSTDGIIWTEVTGWKDISGTNDINAIAYGNGKFVAGGIQGKMAYWEDN